MYTLAQLEKQQIGLRIPQYLIDEIDMFTKQFAINRTDIIIEALRSYLAQQKSIAFYEKFGKSVNDLGNKHPNSFMRFFIGKAIICRTSSL